MMQMLKAVFGLTFAVNNFFQLPDWLQHAINAFDSALAMFACVAKACTVAIQADKYKSFTAWASRKLVSAILGLTAVVLFANVNRQLQMALQIEEIDKGYN